LGKSALLCENLGRLRNATTVEVGHQPRLLRQEFNDRWWRQISGDVPRAGWRLGPHERQLHIGVGTRRAGQEVEHRAENCTLPVGVMRPPKRSAERIADTSQSWHANGARQVRNHRQRHGRNTAGFKYARNQSHGPAAERSRRDERCGVNDIRAHTFRDRRHRLFDQHTRIQNEAHQ